MNDPAAVIAQSALDESSEICVRAMEIFLAAYGAEASNLVLKAFATGGVYIGGGIAPKILPLLQQSNFMAAFLNKGRFAELLAKVPVKVILEPKTALHGAARYLAAQAALY
jgi:glucokinase